MVNTIKVDDCAAHFSTRVDDDDIRRLSKIRVVHSDVTLATRDCGCSCDEYDKERRGLDCEIGEDYTVGPGVSFVERYEDFYNMICFTRG